ncbi:phosphotransferase family protein [Halorussus halophilus]|uniref:phosphotransferase family protein n=1 Tax=Halorussus halophilus TaxID=2650975 RepID=UPI0013018BEC|nr:aminoglycoside phosphotransferase family protein [Halorussus halophilus]
MSNADEELPGPHSRETLRAVVADADTLPDADLLDVTEAESGKNTVYFLTVETATDQHEPDADQHELVLKIGDHHFPEGCRAESVLLGQVAERTDVPVPEVLGNGELGSRDSDTDDSDAAPYFLAERVPGENYEFAPTRLSPESFERVCVEAGRNLGELHAAFPADAFGMLGVEAGAEEMAFVREFADWPTHFETWLAHNAERLEETRFADLAPAIAERAEALADDLRELGPFEPVLTHNDYRLGNVLLDGESGRSQITNAVVDWATPVATTAESELAITDAILIDWPEFDAERQQTLRERLYDGYRETNGDALERDGDFEARRRLYEFGARLRLMVNLEAEMAGRSEREIEARAAEHREVLRDEYHVS